MLGTDQMSEKTTTAIERYRRAHEKEVERRTKFAALTSKENELNLKLDSLARDIKQAEAERVRLLEEYAIGEVNEELVEANRQTIDELKANYQNTSDMLHAVKQGISEANAELSHQTTELSQRNMAAWNEIATTIQLDQAPPGLEKFIQRVYAAFMMATNWQIAYINLQMVCPNYSLSTDELRELQKEIAREFSLPS